MGTCRRKERGEEETQPYWAVGQPHSKCRVLLDWTVLHRFLLHGRPVLLVCTLWKKTVLARTFLDTKASLSGPMTLLSDASRMMEQLFSSPTETTTVAVVDGVRVRVLGGICEQRRHSVHYWGAFTGTNLTTTPTCIGQKLPLDEIKLHTPWCGGARPLQSGCTLGPP